MDTLEVTARLGFVGSSHNTSVSLTLSLDLIILDVRELSLISKDSSREPDWSLDGGSCQDEAVKEWRKEDKSCNYS